MSLIKLRKSNDINYNKERGLISSYIYNTRLRYYLTLSLTFVLLIILFIKQQFINLKQFTSYDTGILNINSNIKLENGYIITYFNQQDLLTLKPLQPSTINPSQFETWLTQEVVIARNKILKNIKFSGNENEWDNNIPLGVLTASPSRQSPNYFYQWTRDSAMTLNALVSDYFDNVETGQKIQIHDILLQYINNSIVLQRLDNLSGKFSLKDKYKGLAEPKFNIDSTPFNENWGRPQNDGPALRIITVLNYLKLLETNSLSVENFTNPNYHYTFNNELDILSNLIYYDLQFIVLNYEESSFDLWEEIVDRHFFTTLVQFYALEKAIKKWENFKLMYGIFPNNDNNLLNQLKTTHKVLLEYLLSKDNFINPYKGYVVESPNLLNIRSGLDIAVILASIVCHPSKSIINSDHLVPFDVYDSGILNTLYSLVQSMSIIYPINHPISNLNIGVALGRYPEDIYDGVHTSEGNPWFIATTSAAELIFKLIESYRVEEKPIVIDIWKTKFWSLFFHESNKFPWQKDLIVTIPYNSIAFNMTLDNLFKYGDSFFEVVRKHMSHEGEMSEQFNKYSGFLQGASDLSWSYSTFLDAIRARNKVQGLTA